MLERGVVREFCGGLGEEWNNLGGHIVLGSGNGKLGDHARAYRYAAVSANNRNFNMRSLGEVSQVFSDKSRSTDDVQGGDAKEPETMISMVSG